MDLRYSNGGAHLHSLARHGGGDHPLASGHLSRFLVGSRSTAKPAPEPKAEPKRGLRARRMTPKRV